MKDKKFKLKANAQVPIFLSVVFLLLYIAGRFVSASVKSTNKYIFALVLELCVYFVPALVFVIVKGKGYIKSLSKTGFKASYIQMSISAAVLITSAGALYSVILCKLGKAEQISESTFGTSGIELISAVLLLIALPALLEEIVFRGIVLTEYKKYGKAVAVLFSAVCFSMFHFSFAGFLYYFICGVVLAIVTVVTESMTVAFFAHLLHNLFAVYGQTKIFNLSSKYADFPFLIFVISVIVLIALFWFLSILDLYYNKLAKTTHYVKSTENKESFVKRLAEVFLSPYFLILVVLYFAVSFGIL